MRVSGIRLSHCVVKLLIHFPDNLKITIKFALRGSLEDIRDKKDYCSDSSALVYFFPTWKATCAVAMGVNLFLWVR